MGEHYTVAAYGVVENGDGEILLARRRESDEWVLPGGSLEDGEPPWEAFVREVREETGLDVEVERLAGVYAKRDEGDLVFVFAASVREAAPRPSDERDRVEFVAPDRLPPALADRHRERIEHATGDRREPVLEVQRSSGDEPPDGTR